MNDREPNLFEEAQRDDAWLAERVKAIWEVHFAGVPRGYPIVTRFATRARCRFGSIAARDGESIILINRLFADPFVPSFVVDGTLAHELAHYAHGFGSGLPQRYQHPHRGGVVDTELELRGLGDVTRRAEEWRAKHWEAFYSRKCADIGVRRSDQGADLHQRWRSFIGRPGNRSDDQLRSWRLETARALGYRSDAKLPFEIDWLYASPRQTGLSYWFAKSRVVKLHGLVADPRVPDAVVRFEMAYWLARQSVGQCGPAIHAALHGAGLAGTADEALRWRRHAWTTFRKRHYP